MPLIPIDRLSTKAKILPEQRRTVSAGLTLRSFWVGRCLELKVVGFDCTVNPLRSRALLAAMLSYDYQLPKVLADVLATAPDEQDSGEFEGVEFIVVDDSEITF